MCAKSTSPLLFFKFKKKNVKLLLCRKQTTTMSTIYKEEYLSQEFEKFTLLNLTRTTYIHPYIFTYTHICMCMYACMQTYSLNITNIYSKSLMIICLKKKHIFTGFLNSYLV